MHKNLYKKGKISLREFRELNLLKARAKNKAFTKGARKEAKRIYKEREKAYGKRR